MPGRSTAAHVPMYLAFAVQSQSALSSSLAVHDLICAVSCCCDDPRVSAAFLAAAFPVPWPLRFRHCLIASVFYIYVLTCVIVLASWVFPFRFVLLRFVIAHAFELGSWCFVPEAVDSGVLPIVEIVMLEAENGISWAKTTH